MKKLYGKMEYEELAIEIIEFENQDVITDSNDESEYPGEDDSIP